MIEITKLRQRIKNLGRNSIEYTMSINEAKALLSEIELLIKPTVKEISVPLPQPIITKILDGGTF